MVSSEDRKPANLLSELRQKERIVFDRTVVVQIRTRVGANPIRTLESRMAFGKVRHVLADLDRRMQHVADIATDEGGYLVLTGRAFAAAPLL
jgi:hypothetical protein